VKIVAHFFTRMLGNTPETEHFWKKLNFQSQSDFRADISREELNGLYLLQALQYHCCIKFVELQGSPS
jgi:hypothetical protein